MPWRLAVAAWLVAALGLSCGGHASDADDAGSPAPVARIVPVERLEPVRAYDRAVVLAPGVDALASRVLDADGAPVAGARVVLWEQVWPHHGAAYLKALDEAVTDDAGRFELGPDGDPTFGSSRISGWRLSVRADGHPRWHGRPVPAGAPVDVQLPRARAVEIELRFDDGEPLAGAELREHITMLGEGRGPDVLPLWTWGRSDADGRLRVLLAVDQSDPLVHVEHPDHRSVRRLALPDADVDAEVEADVLDDATAPGAVVTLLLLRDRGLEITSTGDPQPWTERGLSPPTVRVDHVNEPDGPYALHATVPAHFRFDTRREDDTLYVDHLSDEPLVLRASWRGEALTEPFVPARGRTRLEFPLPTPEPFVPGESKWAFRARVVTRGPEVAGHPWAHMRGADGEERTVALWATADGYAQPVFTDMLPPVSLHYPDWGPGSPRVDGIMPAEEVELVVDGARAGDWSASIRVDTARLDAERAGNLRLHADPLDRSGYTVRGTDRLTGLHAGRWRYRVRGAGVERLEGEVELELGEEWLLRPGSTELPLVDERPRELRAPHGIVEGVVHVDGDPWVWAETVRLRPVEVESAAPAGPGRFAQRQANAGCTLAPVAGGGFRTAVKPGSYRVELLLRRHRMDREQLDAGYLLEDFVSAERIEVVLDPARVIHVSEAGREQLALRTTAPARGLLRVRLLLDGEFAPDRLAPGGYEVTWLRADDGVRHTRSLSLRDGRFELSLPPGRGWLVVRARQSRLGNAGEGLPEAIEARLEVPLPFDAEGKPQALEVELELRSPQVQASGDS